MQLSHHRPTSPTTTSTMLLSLLAASRVARWETRGMDKARTSISRETFAAVDVAPNVGRTAAEALSTEKYNAQKKITTYTCTSNTRFSTTLWTGASPPGMFSFRAHSHRCARRKQDIAESSSTRGPFWGGRLLSSLHENFIHRAHTRTTKPLKVFVG